ncbi:MAG: hypothetical protein J1F03_07385 [Oscillospiraceae bacterium]|nr:hypothetical protein [Oscillospiraceae bacterium]
MSDYSIHNSEKYFNRLEGVLYSKLFDLKLPFVAKNCDEEYAKRCAEFFEALDLDSEAFSELICAGIDYVTELLDERGDEFDLGEEFDEMTPEDFLRITAPVVIVFEKHSLLTDDDSPIGFSIQMRLREVADEFFELAMQEEKPIYAGEYRGVSPWNEKLLKKKWNYVEG